MKRQKQILMIWNDPLAVEPRLFKLVLEKAGYVFSCIGSPEVLFEVLSDREPDLLIIDRHYEVRNGGFELCRSLRSQHNYTFPVLIGFSDAAESSEDKEWIQNKVREVGGSDYFWRVCNIAIVLAQINEIMGDPPMDFRMLFSSDT
jgi:DNA-binding response OmpR family regulator